MNRASQLGSLTVIAAVVPMFGVAAGVLLAPGPRAVVAAADAQRPELVAAVPGPPKLDLRQSAAVVYARALRDSAGTIESPFFTLKDASDAAVLVQTPTAPADERPIPTFVLTSVVRGTTPMAVIDGRLRRVGDLAQDGWTVEQIDPDAGTVRLTHPSRGSINVRLR